MNRVPLDRGMARGMSLDRGNAIVAGLGTLGCGGKWLVRSLVVASMAAISGMIRMVPPQRGLLAGGWFCRLAQYLAKRHEIRFAGEMEQGGVSTYAI